MDAWIGPAVADEVTGRTRTFTRPVEPDLIAAGRPNPAEAALLWVVMARETAVAEEAVAE
ncbi:hypothetical protein F8568_044870 [Actinomadura sp. LD22]|uniref:Uncharacterized protein n=2 Tax=Actinomadura physcomitrii TaxID=2650748 RepID=A0A6I4MTR1_9ACTN|nr:hypothetical protein [Actinomadura physcomitrii]